VNSITKHIANTIFSVKLRHLGDSSMPPLPQQTMQRSA